MVRITIISFLLLSFFSVSAQNNRLTNENGQLLWQYNQHITENEKSPDTFLVTFVFVNGINQTAITLRQNLFKSDIEWWVTDNMKVEKTGHVDFFTTNLAPNQSIVVKYYLKSKSKTHEYIAEKSALLIMNEQFEIRKEIIPEQKFKK